MIFSTKNKEPLIEEAVRRKLHKYIVGILNRMRCVPIVCNGTDNHVHTLFDLHPRRSLSEVVKHVKGGSSHWMNKENRLGNYFKWQRGYGAFSVSFSNMRSVVRYIENQMEIHAERDFDNEMKLLNNKHKIMSEYRLKPKPNKE